MAASSHERELMTCTTVSRQAGWSALSTGFLLAVMVPDMEKLGVPFF
jgi:hypothetical protein